jgi:hypothetical protein
MNTVHDLVLHIINGMERRTKRFKSRIAEKPPKQLHDLFE